jgi:hypothetical protein
MASAESLTAARCYLIVSTSIARFTTAATPSSNPLGTTGKQTSILRVMKVSSWP